MWPDLDDDAVPNQNLNPAATGLLVLDKGVGRGQENEPHDVAAMDSALRRVGVYVPEPPYDKAPASYIHESMIAGLEKVQERHGLAVDGYARPRGESHQTINNTLLGKPKGAGLARFPVRPLQADIGAGGPSHTQDITHAKRALGALGHIPEDPFDTPHDFVDDKFVAAVSALQRRHGLPETGTLHRGSATETALHTDLAQHAARNAAAWREFWRRKEAAERDAGILPVAMSNTGAESTTAGTDDGPASNESRDRSFAWPSGAGRAPTEDTPGDRDGAVTPAALPAVIPPAIGAILRGLGTLGQRGGGLAAGGAIGSLVTPDSGTGLRGPGGRIPGIAEPRGPGGRTPGLVEPRGPGGRTTGLIEPRGPGSTLPPPLPTYEDIMRRPGYDGFVPATPAELPGDLGDIVVERKGNEPVRVQNFDIVTKVKAVAAGHRCKPEHSGGSRRMKGDGTVEEIKETYLKPKGGGRAGGSYADITFSVRNGARRLFVNTYDVANRAFDATARELRNAVKLLKNAKNGDLLLMIPKLLPGQELDGDALAHKIAEMLDRLCDEADAGDAPRREPTPEDVDKDTFRGVRPKR